MTARASACVLLVACSAAGAQSTRELRFEGGAAQIRQTGHAGRDALVLGALWRLSEARLATLLSGAMTFARDSVAAAQGIAAFAARPSAQSWFQTEGGVSAAAFGISSLAKGGNFGGYARERFGRDAAGVWFGAALGYTQRLEQSAQSTTVDVGAWGRTGDFEATLAYARSRSNDWPLLEAAQIFRTQDTNANELADVIASLRWVAGELEVDVSHAWRSGLRSTLASQTAFYWSVAYALSERFTVAVGAGRQLTDPVRGMPDAQLASAVLRLALLAPRATSADGATSYASLLPEAEGAVLVVRVVASDTSRVEVAGSFSGWEPVPLRKTGAGWEAQIRLPSGRHRVAVRIDGGPWRAPGNVAKLKDEFGGESGLVVIP